MTSGSVAPPFAPALHHLDDVFRGLRAGRANAGLVENIEVQAYGSRMRLKELAAITTPDGRTIQVEPWDKSVVPAIAKALAASPLGVNPVTAGMVIRVPLPPLSAERRQELTKLVRQRVEETKISVRNTREKLLKELKGQKDVGTLSENAFERERKKLQTDVDAVTAAIEERGQAKEQEIIGPGPM